MTRQAVTSLNEQTTPAVPVVAIGASAGGLETVSELFTHLSPTTGLAFVYIQQEYGPTLGDPTLGGPTKNNPLAILSRATTMPVAAVEDQMPIQPNQVYLIAPQSDRKNPDWPEHDLEMIDGVLTFVVRRHPPTGAPAAAIPTISPGDQLIDQFFIKLADRQRDGAVAVLLSGTTSDGTLGMRAIRITGGLTFAQDESARFQSMPRSAIGEGVVGRVLPPAEIARELEQLSQRPTALRQAAGANAPEKANAGPLEDLGEWDERTEEITDQVETDQNRTGVAAPADELEADGAPDTTKQATEEDLQAIIQVLRKSVGTDFSNYKMTTIRRRIIRRMLLFRLETLGNYADYLRQHPNETQALYDDLLINVTTFFRDDDTMDYLQKVLLPQLVRNKAPQELLRIWVPACSTGQEAYSIAMLLLETLGDRAMDLTIQLFATDLSRPAVVKARLGSYTPGEVMDVSPRRLQRFFTKVDGHYRINKAVRDLCVFAPHNLLKDPPFSRLDLISCRNLLIYLDAQMQRKVIATFHYALNPSGHLLLGKSETVGSPSPFFSPVETNYKVYTRKNDGSADAVAGRVLFEVNPRFGLSQTAKTASNQDAPIPAGLDGQPARAGSGPDGTGRPKVAPVFQSKKAVWPVNDVDRVVDGLLSQYVPASVVVNAELDILQFRGSTGLFLEAAPGRATLNLLKMARPALAFELRNIIYKADQSGQPVRRSGLEIKVNGEVHYVAIEAVPFSTNTDERLFLVLFNEVTAIVTADSDATDARNSRITQLRDELATLRDDMRSVIEEQEGEREELQSANEEIISSNEELQSINEELETSKEEIESTNEELLTINQELQLRNDQLSEANAFAEAIFGTIREATLVLTPDLRVKSANPMFYSLFGLTEGETQGRLIYELANRQWDIPQLRSLLTDVATRNVQVQGFELTYPFPEVGEKVLSLNARRVVQQREAILLAIEDITEHRWSQRLLEEREAWFHQIANNAPTLTWVTGPDGRYTFFNNVWLDYTGQSQPDALANGWDQYLHPDDRAGYQQTQQAHFNTQQPFLTEYRLRRHDDTYRWMLQNAQPVFNPDGQFTSFISTAADIHGQKELNAELDWLVAERTLDLTNANDQLTKSSATINQMLNGSMTAICLMESVRDETGEIVDFVFRGISRAAGVMNQLLEANLLGERFLTRFPGTKKVFFDDYVRVVETGEPLRTERYYQGEHFDNWFDVSAVKNGDGFIMTFYDITDRRQAEERMQQTTSALQAVLDNSPASIGLLKAIRTPAGAIADFQLAVANQRFAQLVGQPLEQIHRLRASQLVDQLLKQQTLTQLTHVVETGEPFYVEQPHPISGWLALSVTKQDDGVVVTGLDISDLKQMQQQREDLLNQARQSTEMVEQLSVLQEQVRARGELLRTASHDLRGSLGVIQGAADLLSFANSDEERAQMLDMIQRNVQETTHLITELLDYSRLEAGQQQVQLAPFDAAGLLRKLGENVRPLVEGNGLTLHLSGEEPLLIEGDALNVLRMAQNIVLNALKYTVQGGITVRWGNNGPDEWFFSVDDTGPGMDQQVAYQLSHGLATPGQPAALDGAEPASLLDNKPLLGPARGEGIGLVIVRQLCDLLRGRLLVESQPGRGSVFRVLLPRRY